MEKRYIGDSVYVQVAVAQDGLVLTTENGDGPPSNTIFLEPAVIDEFIGYLNEALAEMKEDA